MSIHSTLVTDASGAELGFHLSEPHLRVTRPEHWYSRFSPAGLTVGAGRGTDRSTRVGDDRVVRPGLVCTPGSENWTWVLGAVKPVGSALEPGVRKVPAVVAVAAGVVKPAPVVVDIVSPEKYVITENRVSWKNIMSRVTKCSSISALSAYSHTVQSTV